ncbi:hypothetical protein FQZ97_765430 [compost metagenome]
MPLFERFQQAGQFAGGQVDQLQARLVEVQFMATRAVAGQVDKDQVLRSAAIGQRLYRTGQAFAGGQWAIGDMVAVVGQGDAAAGGEAFAEQLGDVVGLAQKHALLAVAGQGQGV